ncbi:MAG TPA: pilus assembly protein TadG-related protein [Actinomycetota bacterium]|nr:pilus assembly protein TadG-related protein [Actinomycetota bacterium]
MGLGSCATLALLEFGRHDVALVGLAVIVVVVGGAGGLLAWGPDRPRQRERVWRFRQDERGQATLIILVWVLIVIALVGVVSDGGQALAQRRELQGFADGAARAGAAALNQDALVGANVAQIDPQQARAAVAQYLSASGFTGSSPLVNVTPGEISVSLTQSYHPTFDQFIGISNVTLHASSSSAPVSTK